MKCVIMSVPDLSSFVAALSYFEPLQPRVVEYLQDHSSLIYIPKKKLLLKAGSICNHVYFIKKGAVRGFIRESKKDITTWITVENELVTSIAGLDTRSASIDNLQTLEDCELLAINFEDIDKLYTRYPSFNSVIRKLLQRYYRDAESRALLLRLNSAEKKYNYFLQTQGHLANRVPLKVIASYLAIAEATLSRVRRKLVETP